MGEGNAFRFQYFFPKFRATTKYVFHIYAKIKVGVSIEFVAAEAKCRSESAAAYEYIFHVDFVVMVYVVAWEPLMRIINFSDAMVSYVSIYRLKPSILMVKEVQLFEILNSPAAIVMFRVSFTISIIEVGFVTLLTAQKPEIHKSDAL